MTSRSAHEYDQAGGWAIYLLTYVFWPQANLIHKYRAIKGVK